MDRSERIENGIQYYYKWTFKFLNGQKPMEVPIYKVTNVSKTNDYGSSFFPALTVDMLIESKYLPNLKINKKTLLVYGKLEKFGFVSNNGSEKEDGAFEQVSQDEVYERVFAPFFGKDVFSKPLGEEADPPEEPEPGDSLAPSEIKHSNVQIILYDMKSLVINKGMINTRLGPAKGSDPADISTALMYIINKTSIERAIVDKPDNDLPYTNIILDAANLRNSIHYLQNVYGIYNYGLLTFLDYDMLYILSRYAEGHDYEKDDLPYNRIYVNDDPNGATGFTLVNRDKETKEIIYDISDTPKSEDIATVSGEIHGDMTIFTNFGMGYSCIQFKDGKVIGSKSPILSIGRTTTSHDSTGKKVSIEYDELNNPQLMMSSLRAASIDSITIITINGVDIDSLRPNKIYNIVFPTAEKTDKDGGLHIPINDYVRWHPLKQSEGKMIGMMTTQAVVTLCKMPEE